MNIPNASLQKSILKNRVERLNAVKVKAGKVSPDLNFAIKVTGSDLLLKRQMRDPRNRGRFS